jgi:hypothetical protein
MRRLWVFLLILMPSVVFGQSTFLPIPYPSTPNIVDFEDFILFAQAYQSQESDPHYHPVADLNSDGRVNFLDFLLFVQAFGQTYQGPAMKQILDRRYYPVIDVFGDGLDEIELQAFPFLGAFEPYDQHHGYLIVKSIKFDTYAIYIIGIPRQ